METSFQISKTVLLKFFPKFLQWFLKEYYAMYVAGMSGVGFDTLVEIESSEWIFRGLGLPGFITVMDAVHMAYDTAPFTARQLFMGKEGYPTVGVNMHCNELRKTEGLATARAAASIFLLSITRHGICFEICFRDGQSKD